MLTRQEFIRQSVIAAAGLTFLGCGEGADRGEADGGPTNAPEKTPAMPELPYLSTIGLQLWSVRDQMEKDPRTTLKTLSEIGYQQVELMDTTHAAELVPIAREYGLAVNSSFINWNTVTGGWQYTPDTAPFEFDEVIDQAGEHGIDYLIFGYLRPEERTSADDWKRLADQLNEAAQRAGDNGLKMAYHNHNFEWDPVEGTTGFDLLTERMDGGLVPWELDVFWAAIAGQDPKSIMDAAKDRLELLHLKQLKPGTAPVTRIDDVPADSFEELPNGDLPIKAYMELGKRYGVAHCMVEQDGNYAASSLASVEESINFLRKNS